MVPFNYPTKSHQRRHGPRGYGSLESYRPWLRDEYEFRCVYCLDREQWQNSVGKFAIEHFLPVSSHPEKRADYENLVYSCVSCNLTKGQAHVPDPTQTLLAESVVIHDDGRMEARTKEAAKLIDKLLLNSEDCRTFRRRWIRIIRLAQQHSDQLYRELMEYPADLPDLSRLRPPGGNSRPEGIEQSHAARRERGELPDVY